MQPAFDRLATANAGPNLSYEISDKLRDSAWDALVAAIPESHFEQTSGWGAVKAQYGWQVFRVVAAVDGNAVGGVQVLTRSLGRLGKIGYVSRGPIAKEPDKDLTISLADEVCRIARSESWLYCVFDYPYNGNRLAAQMAPKGFFAHPPGIPPSGLLTATTVVDLRPTEAEIMARITRNARHDIRLAQRSDLIFEEGGPEDLPRFRQLMLATCARRKSPPTPPQEDYFKKLWQELGGKGWVRLFLVRCGDEVVSAVFAFTISNTIRLWKYGWSGAYTGKHPNHLLYWGVIRWAKSKGFQNLDFVWIDTEDAKRAARGELSPRGFRDGTTAFKLGFGGALILLPPPQSAIFNPLFRCAYNFGGGRILASRLMQSALSGYWARKAAQ